MHFSFHKPTLSRNYFIFATVVAILVVLIGLWRAWSMYSFLEKDRAFRYGEESDQLAHSLEESFAYIENFMNFMAEKVAAGGSNNPAAIASILQANRNVGSKNHNNAREDEDIFTWTMFDFVTPEGLVVASSTQGLIPSPKKVLPNQRSWMLDAPKNPWHLLISWPDIGITSGERMLPVGYGVTDANNRFLGTISMGFNLAKLTRKLERSLTQSGMSFVLLDKQLNFISASSDVSPSLPPDYFKKHLSAITLPSSRDSDELETPLELEDVRYTFYRHTYRYPFIILVGENKYYLRKEFRQAVYPRIEESIYMGAFFLVLLYFFQRKIIQPVTLLSQAAISISRGEEVKPLPPLDAHEYNVLASQLNRISDFIRDLYRTRSELEEALNAKSTFLSSMSHELRTPLNAVIGFSEGMKYKIHGELNDKYAEYADDINSQGQYLLRLIEQILEASKFDAGMVELSEDVIDVHHTLQKIIKSSEKLANQSGVRLTAHFPEDLPFLYADPLKFKQMILNLLSNAFKFTPVGGRIHISAQADEEFLVVVEDTGVGIAEKDLPRVTKRFVQIDNPLSAKGRGSGLGMSITKDIMELHAGKLEVNSTLGKGTVVTLRFPKRRIRWQVPECEV